MKRLTILNRNEQKLSAILHEADVEKLFIFTHSFKGDKNYQPIMSKLPEALEMAGWSSIRYDCWGSGESDGNYENSAISTQINDLKDIIVWARKKGFTKIVLGGLSLGTTISMFACDKDISGLLLLSPVFQHAHLHENYADEMKKNSIVVRKRNLTNEDVRVGRKMWEEFKDCDTKNVIPSIQAPMLAIIGTNDHHVSLKAAENYLKMHPGKHELYTIKDGDHDFLEEHALEKGIKKSVSWIKELE